MIDSHCHLTYISKNIKELEEVLKRANKEKIYYIVDIGVHPNDLDERYKLFKNAEGVFLAAGYYPDYANEYDEDDIAAFKMKIETLNSLEKNKKVICSIGEIGLDYYHNSENKNEQMEFFSSLMNVAKELNLPVLIHTRDAFNDTFKILKDADNEKRGILHCFSGGVEEARKAIELGYILSFSGSVTYPKNTFIREAAKYAPSDMFTVETDAPYLTPQKLRGRRNEPSFIPYIAEVIADARAESVESVLQKSLDNARRILELNI